MKINLDELLKEIERAQLPVRLDERTGYDKSVYATELIEVLRDALASGISAYELVETATIEFQRMRRESNMENGGEPDMPSFTFEVEPEFEDKLNGSEENENEDQKE